MTYKTEVASVSTLGALSHVYDTTLRALSDNKGCSLVRFIPQIMLMVCALWGAAAQAQTQVLIGGALKVCSSSTPEFCSEPPSLNAPHLPLYQLDEHAIERMLRAMPDAFAQHKEALAAALRAIPSNEALTRSALVDKWFAQDAKAQLLDIEIQDYVLDSLQVAHTDTRTKHSKEQVFRDLTASDATRDILSFVANAVRLAAKEQSGKAKVVSITASSRDPYASADYYQQLFSFDDIDSEWLALTPALVQAISVGNCERLEEFRNNAGVFNRARVYPDLVAQEQALCEQGVDALLTHISSATAVVFNGGDQSRALTVLFDSQGQPYPWTQALRTAPVIVGTSAGTALQSGGNNIHGPVPMITSGDAIVLLSTEHAQKKESAPSALAGFEALSYVQSGGLGSFSDGVLDTHFSERNRTLRLHNLLLQTGQGSGYGVDETSALVVITSQRGNIATVLGKSGVVKITPLDTQRFSYSYYPAGVRLQYTDNQWRLLAKTPQEPSVSAKGQTLPNTRFNDILYDGKLRSLTQAMCLTNTDKALAQQYWQGKMWDFTLEASEATTMFNTSTNNNACVIEDLIVSYTLRSE
ncbi:cyanophycinase [Pseudoalteromonas sp. SSDWG2]|uniref:cyanophycinase n=1 Tax=Pseudoalteromonas sp. SSDWG2 TaxID=3139391 RepID=UPI003BA8EC2A